jgi:hypothetical protein
LVREFVRKIQAAPINAYQVPLAEEGSRCRLRGNGPDNLIMQQTHGLPAQAGSSLGDAGFGRNVEVHLSIGQPLGAFHKAPKHLAVGSLHVEGQRDDVVDDDMGREVALAGTGSARPSQDVLDQGSRKGFGDHAEADVVRNPAVFSEPSGCTCHIYLYLQM